MWTGRAVHVIEKFQLMAAGSPARATALHALASVHCSGASGQPCCSSTVIRPSINSRPVPACKSAAEAAAATAVEQSEGQQQQQQQQQQPGPLEALLLWLLANGAEGVGEAGSKAGLYEGAGGERGLVALADIGEGEAVLRLPLRLAITDYEEEQEALAGQGGGDGTGREGQREEHQPWSVRLATRLLALRAQGPTCPWAPYLACLPPRVPSPLTSFTWEDVRAVEYQPMLRELDRATWLASDAAVRLAGAGYSRGEVDWALSVVHSRSFGAPGKAGAVAVRMLVPLVDMLNHAGDAVVSSPGAQPPALRASDNVRWDLRAAAPGGGGGGWTMVVSATRAIAAGEELLLSYGERANDDFLAHYGFVPPRNPHDSVALFSDIESAIEWWLDAFLPLGALPPTQLQAAISAAFSAAEQEDGGGPAAEAALAAMPEAEAAAARAELATIRLSAGGLVDGRLLAAYRSLQASCAAAVQALRADWAAHMRAAVARRAAEVLRGMPTPLLEDLRVLAAWEAAGGDAQHGWCAALQHYGPLLEQHEGLVAGGGGATSAGCSSEERQPATLVDAGAGELAAALGGLPGPQQLESSARWQQAQGDSEQQQQPPSMLPIIFRAYKKLILWDALLLE